MVTEYADRAITTGWMGGFPMVYGERKIPTSFDAHFAVGDAFRDMTTGPVT